MWSKKSKSAAKVDTLIGQNTELRGDVMFTGGLHVDGTIRGNIIAENESGSVLSLSERGLIEGEVRVPNVILNGCVNGDVYAAEHVELAANARVNGNVYYKLIEMARGSEVNGSLVHRDSNGAKANQEPAARTASGATLQKQPEPVAKSGEQTSSATNAGEKSDKAATPGGAGVK